MGSLFAHLWHPTESNQEPDDIRRTQYPNGGPTATFEIRPSPRGPPSDPTSKTSCALTPSRRLSHAARRRCPPQTSEAREQPVEPTAIGRGGNPEDLLRCWPQLRATSAEASVRVGCPQVVEEVVVARPSVRPPVKAASHARSYDSDAASSPSVSSSLPIRE